MKAIALAPLAAGLMLAFSANAQDRVENYRDLRE